MFNFDKLIEELNKPKKEVPKPTRCCLEGCKKKLLLSDFACKCGSTYCSTHRISESHGCSFDYKKEHTNNLLKTMSTSIVAKKVESI